jgi:hypothetical protein
VSDDDYAYAMWEAQRDADRFQGELDVAARTHDALVGKLQVAEAEVERLQVQLEAARAALQGILGHTQLEPTWGREHEGRWVDNLWLNKARSALATSEEQ